MVNSVDPDRTAPIESILNSSVMLGNYLQQTTFSDAFFSWRIKGQSTVNVLKFQTSSQVKFWLSGF